MYLHNNDVTYFDSFGVQHIPKEMKTFINNENIKTNILRIQAYDSIMCGKTLTEFTNLFSPNNFKRNDGKILNYFMNNV